MDMKKDFRIWLNESSYNDFIARAMDQANEGNYKDNLQFEANFKRMVDSDHDPVALKKFLEEKPDLLLLVLKYKVSIIMLVPIFFFNVLKLQCNYCLSYSRP